MNASPRVAIPVPTSTDLEYNRRSWPMYGDAVRRSGGVPVEVALSLSEREVVEIMRGCDGVLLPGSPFDIEPSRYGQDRTPACAPSDRRREEADRLLLSEAYAGRKPVLGICYGAQSLNVWRGGTLAQDVACTPVNHAAGAGVAVAHTANLLTHNLLAGLTDESEISVMSGERRLPINSSHHQAVQQPGDGLVVAARAAEDLVVEAVEGAGLEDEPEFVLGVQWHPERSMEVSATSRLIFEAFVRACAAGLPSRQAESTG